MTTNSKPLTDAEVAAKCGVSVGDIILSRLIDTLSNAERRELHTALAAHGMTEFPRNLFFNYSTQEYV